MQMPPLSGSFWGELMTTLEAVYPSADARSSWIHRDFHGTIRHVEL
jgi:hypothetical protein